MALVIKPERHSAHFNCTITIRNATSHTQLAPRNVELRHFLAVKATSTDYTLKFKIAHVSILFLEVLVLGNASNAAHDDAGSAHEQARDNHAQETHCTEVVRGQAEIERIVRQVFSQKHWVHAVSNCKANLNVVDRE